MWKCRPKPTDLDLISFHHLILIMRLANIELARENLHCAGDLWNVERTINEDKGTMS